MRKRVALIMPVFNKLEYTSKCVNTLEPMLSDSRFSNSVFSMVIVDDGSTDGSGRWLREHHPWITVLEGDGNLWWSGGVNMGTAHALEVLHADYLLLWNNDVVPADDYFIQMDRLLGEIPSDVVAGSKIFQLGNERMLWSCGGVFNPRNGNIYMHGFEKPDSEEFAQPMEVDWQPGMGTLIPSGVIRKIGYWDQKHFPQYHGDSDYTLRAKEAGFRIVTYPNLALFNDQTNTGLAHGGSWKGLFQVLTSIRSNLNFRKYFYFYRKHARSPLAYLHLVKSYYKIIGGFFKWKVLSLFGIRKRLG